MGESWTAERFRRRRRRALYISLSALIISGFATAFAAVRHHGPSRVDTASAPGFRSGDRPIDTAPFKQAGPNQVVAATTIPGGPGGVDLDRDPNSTNSTTSTTTTAPLPPAPTGDAACQALRTYLSLTRVLPRIQRTAAAIKQAALGPLREASDQLRSTGEARYQPTLDLVTQISDALQAAVSFDQAFTALEPIVGTSSPEANTAVGPLIEHALSACPGLSPA